MIHDGSCTACQLSIIPARARVSVEMALQQATTFFVGCTGSVLFVPTHDLPFGLRREFPTVEGTRIEEYTPILDPFLWQFSRSWMGQAAAKQAYLAAPVEHVRGALHDDLFLVKGPEALMRIFPEDCNIHWHEHAGEPTGKPGARPSAFAMLLSLLQKTGVVLSENEDDASLLALCQRWSIPFSRESEALSCSSRRATSFVWFLPKGSGQGSAAQLVTVFPLWYGMDIDD